LVGRLDGVREREGKREGEREREREGEREGRDGNGLQSSYAVAKKMKSENLIPIRLLQK